MIETPALPFPARLQAPGTAGAAFRPLLRVEELPAGSHRRVTVAELDLLVANVDGHGLLVVDDRCPHMSAPLSLGVLDGCVVGCPLHDGRFDLCTGEPVQMPTTGGLDPDGAYRPGWTPAGRTPKVDVPGLKAEARRLTRVQRLRYYPIRVVDGTIEAAIPEPAGPPA